MAALAGESEYSDDFDISSYGTRCAISENGNTVYIKESDKKITVYSVNSGKRNTEITTKYSPYCFWIVGNKLITIEKNGNDGYLETVDLTMPTTFDVQAPKELNISGSGEIKATTNSSYKLDYTYKSSDSKIVSVDKNGKLTAWKAGSATITVTSPTIGVTKKVTIKVNGEKGGSSLVTKKLDGTVSTNIHAVLNGGMYGNTIDSYIKQNKDGGFDRVELIKNKLVINRYNKSLKLTVNKSIKLELPIFGGVYMGENYNYVAVGKSNKKESDSAEVFRFIKYDKNWKRISSCSIKGANTYIPVEAGGLSMTEHNGVLYVYTCHEMYKSSDGFNHQSNCTFVVDETTMKLKDSFTDVMNISYGYVSHSFMQFIKTDGKDIYRADLGDGYPRGIVLTKTKIGEKITSPNWYGTIVSIAGNIGNNYTGYALSGLELSDDYYIVAGLGVKKQSDSQRNIFLSSGEKSSPGKNCKWITNYKNSSKVEVGQPKLVKITKNQFLLMWEESIQNGKKITTKMMLINPDGTAATKIYSTSLSLSACEPTVDNNGNVVWYVTNNSKPTLIKINPFDLEKVSSESGKLKSGSKTSKLGKVKFKAIRKNRTKIKLKINKVKNAGKYQIQYSTSSKLKKAKFKTTTKTTYTIKKLNKKKTYYIRIRAINGKWSGKKKVK